MNIDIGKTIRMSDIIDARDGRSLIVDTTMASVIGATEGLEHVSEAIGSVNEFCDAIIVNPGTAEHHAPLLGGKNRATPVIRVDWTNAFRGEDFCLPATDVKRLMVSDGSDALELGASAVIASLLFGFDDDFESTNIRDLSHLARECQTLFLPLFVDIQPIGDRVSEENFEESIKLGCSFMLELGAEALLIPSCSAETLKFICDWMSVPVLVRQDTLPSKDEIEMIFENGAAGIVLSHRIFAQKNLSNEMEKIHWLIHEKEAVQ